MNFGRAAFLGAVSVSALAVSGGGYASLSEVDLLQDELRVILDKQAERYNTSFSFAVKTADFEVAVAAGVTDHVRGLLADETDLYPGGSVTKSYTAVLVLQLKDQGILNLSDFVYAHVDPWLAKQQPPMPPLRELWNNTLIEQVTIRQLLSMQSGIKDYDDAFVHNFTFTYPKSDFLPLDYVDNVEKDFFFQPDKGAAYSSVGYILLGLVAAANTGAQKWQDLDQTAVFRPPYANYDRSSVGNETVFLGLGPCSSQKNALKIVHQYDLLEKHSIDAKDTIGTVSYFDVYDESCLNGWTMGNMAATARDVARFWWAVFREGLVSPASLHDMIGQFNPFTSGFALGLKYGTGLMKYEPYSELNSTGSMELLGHVGLDYGSGFTLNGYSMTFNMSVALATNVHYGIGMNCSLPEWSENGLAAWETGCMLVNHLQQTLYRRSPVGLPPTQLDCVNLPPASKTALPPWWYSATRGLVPTKCLFPSF